MINSTNGEGGASFLGLSRSIRELSFVYPGSNSGHGSVILIPAIEGCGCDYRCVALDEYRSLVACICPEGLRLKPDNLTACECKIVTYTLNFISISKFSLQLLKNHLVMTHWLIFSL